MTKSTNRISKSKNPHVDLSQFFFYIEDLENRFNIYTENINDFLPTQNQSQLSNGNRKLLEAAKTDL